jgi:hypothetical protein
MCDNFIVLISDDDGIASWTRKRVVAAAAGWLVG